MSMRLPMHSILSTMSEEDIEKKKSYLALILLTQDVLVSSIYLLGMKAPERM